MFGRDICNAQSVERSGEYNKEENFSITLESAGTITYTVAV